MISRDAYEDLRHENERLKEEIAALTRPRDASPEHDEQCEYAFRGGERYADEPDCRCAHRGREAAEAEVQRLKSTPREWPSCGHTATGVCFTCYVERGKELTRVETKGDG